MTEQPSSKESLDKAAQALRECMESGYGLVVEMVDAVRLVKIMVREGNLGVAQPPDVIQLEGECPSCRQWVVLRSDTDEAHRLPPTKETPRGFNAEEARAYGQFIDDAFEKPSGEKSADQLATEDAMAHGSGFVRVMPDGSREHVPHHDVFIEPSDETPATLECSCPEYRCFGHAERFGRKCKRPDLNAGKL